MTACTLLILGLLTTSQWSSSRRGTLTPVSSSKAESSSATAPPAAAAAALTPPPSERPMTKGRRVTNFSTLTRWLAGGTLESAAAHVSLTKPCSLRKARSGGLPAADSSRTSTCGRCAKDDVVEDEDEDEDEAEAMAPAVAAQGLRDAASGEREGP
jgi:hypothetical protein